MFVILLLLAILHTGLAAIAGYEEVENSFLSKLGKMYTIYLLLQFLIQEWLNASYCIELSFYYKGLNRRPVVEKNLKIPSATMELYNSMSNAMTTHFPLPGLHTTSANTAKTYYNKGNSFLFIDTYILYIYTNYKLLIYVYYKQVIIYALNLKMFTIIK